MVSSVIPLLHCSKLGSEVKLERERESDERLSLLLVLVLLVSLMRSVF